MDKLKIVVLGASGLVGNNFMEYYRMTSHQVWGTYLNFPLDNLHYFNSNDLSHQDNLNLISLRPDVIINCASLTNVDWCEKNQKESFEKTVLSSSNLVKISRELQCKLVYISTDYVFDGKNGPYEEEDPTNPINIYGMHKHMCEQEIRSSLSDFLIVRVTNVYGNETRNKNFVSRIIQDIKNEQKKELNLAFDQYGTPINAFDIAKATARLIDNKKKGVYHLSSTDLMNRFQFANKVTSFFGYEDLVLTPKSTIELKQDALRPLKGGLKAMKFLSEFPDFKFTNLDDYLHKSV